MKVLKHLGSSGSMVSWVALIENDFGQEILDFLEFVDIVIGCVEKECVGIVQAGSNDSTANCFCYIGVKRGADMTEGADVIK